MKITDIKPNPGNPRLIKDDKFKKLCKSISEFPQMMALRPIIVDADGVILGGNMRYQALKHNGIKDLPDEWVRRAEDLTEDEKKRFIITDNSSFGEYDWDMIANEWDDLPLGDWGLDVPEFTGLEAKDAEEDDYEIPDEIQTDIVLGDLIEIGEHRLMCGDSTDGGNVEKLMDDKQAVLIHADPPYGMGKEKDGVLNDNLYGDKLDRFQMEWWTAFRPYLTNNASAYIWGNAPDLWRLWYREGLVDSERVTLRNEIVWDKKAAGAGGISHMGAEGLRQYPAATERCLFFMLGEQGFNDNADNYWDGWEPIRTYLVQEMKECGWTTADLNRITGTQMAGHWVTKSQWGLITAENYNKIKQAAREHDAFKREHDELKREFYGTRAYFDNAHDNMTDVWQFERVKGADRHGHATPKPVEMISRIIKSSSPDNALLIEPFLGSGTTMVAAHQLNRKCYGMELDPKYCQVIVDRMLKLDPTLTLKRNGEVWDRTQMEQ